MKTLILSCALPLLATLAAAQTEPATPPIEVQLSPETVKKAAPASWLGIVMTPDEGKVLVGDVLPDSPAAKAGLQKGDILLAINDKAIQGEMKAVADDVASRAPGETISIRIRRGEKEETLKVPLAARPDEKVIAPEPAPAWMGIAMNLEDGKVVVGKVLPDGPAAKAGLKEGDQLLRVGDMAVDGDVNKLTHYVSGRKPGEVLEVRVQRGDKEETLKVELGARGPEYGDFRGEFRRKELPPAKEAPPFPEKAKERIKEKIKEDVEKVKDLQEKMQKKIEEHREHLKDLEPKLKELREKRLEFKLDPDHSFEKPELRLEYGPAPGKKQDLLKEPKQYGFRQFKADDLEWEKGKKEPVKEDAIWNRVEESVARSLKESGLGPDVIEKAMAAVKNARKNGPEQQARRAKLEAEAAKVEKEMQSLKERAGKIREELNKSGE